MFLLASNESFGATCLLTSSGMGRSPGTEREVKRKRTPGAPTLCQVCNIQLNSSAQAQIHYNGKTHQRRLRQATRAKSSSGARVSTGNAFRNPAFVSGGVSPLHIRLCVYVCSISIHCMLPSFSVHLFSIHPVQMYKEGTALRSSKTLAP